MATSKSKAPVLKDCLIKSKEQFKDDIKERMDKGEEMFKRVISNSQEWQKLRSDYELWDDYNGELLRQSFENPENVYYKDYTYRGISFGTIGGGYHQPSLQELVSDTKEDIKEQYDRLEKIHEKAGLMVVSPTCTSPLVKEDPSVKALESLENLFIKFHKVAKSLRVRHADRATIVIEDEYDVQDLTRGLLKLYFNDVRDEDYVPSYAGSNSRIDFALKEEKIIVEIKITSERNKDKEMAINY